MIIHSLTCCFKISSFHNVSEDYRWSQKIADVFRPFRALKRSDSQYCGLRSYRKHNLSDVFRCRGFQRTFWKHLQTSAIFCNPLRVPEDFRGRSENICNPLQNISEDFTMFQTTPCCRRGFQMISDGFRTFQSISEDFRRFQSISCQTLQTTCTLKLNWVRRGNVSWWARAITGT